MRYCSVKGCENKHLAKGYCRAHYQRVRRTGRVGSAETGWKHPTGTCEVEGCENKHNARGLCQTHYRNSRTGQNYRFQRLYGITLAEYEERVAAQGGACGICGRTPKKLDVDHDHETEEVRGLLCNPCNRAIGLLGDNPDTLQRAIDYLAP